MLILLLHHISHLPPSFNNHHFENFNHSIPWKCLLFTHQSTGTMPCPHQSTNQTNAVTIVCFCPHFNPFFTVSFLFICYSPSVWTATPCSETTDNMITNLIQIKKKWGHGKFPLFSSSTLQHFNTPDDLSTHLFPFRVKMYPLYSTNNLRYPFCHPLNINTINNSNVVFGMSRDTLCEQF